MAAKTFLLLNSTAAGSTYGSLQDGGTTTTATTITGWTVGTTAATAYANQVYNSEVAAATFGATPQPSAAPANAGECWRSQNTLTGHFEAGTWTVALSVISVTAGASGAGRLRVRIWKSVNADGTVGTELTTSTMSTGQWTNLTTSTAQNLTATQSLAAVAFANEYLFIEVACEIDTASASASADVLVRIDQTNSKATTALFDPSLAGDYLSSPTPSDGTASYIITTGQKYAGELPIGTFNSVTYYKMQGYYAAGLTYENWIAVGAPNLTPPSGHTLTNITVVGKWSQ